MADETDLGGEGGELGDLNLRIGAEGEQSTLDALKRVDDAARKTSEHVNDAVRASTDATKRAAQADTEAAIREFARLDNARRLREGRPLATGGLGGQPITPVLFEQTDRTKAAREAQAKLNREIQEEVRLLGVVLRTSDVTNAGVVANLRENIAAQRDWLKSVGATQLQMARLDQSVHAFDKRVDAVTQTQRRAAAEAARAAAQHRILGVSIDTVNGSLNRFGRSGLTVLNAVSFGMTTMAATGTASFRSIASASASFLAIFGAGGAIASVFVSLGLVISETFQRARHEMEETRKKMADELVKMQRSIEQASRQNDQATLESIAKRVFQGDDEKVGQQEVLQKLQRARADLAQAEARALESGQTIQENVRRAAALREAQKIVQDLELQRDLMELQLSDLMRRVQEVGDQFNRKPIEVTASRPDDTDILDIIEKQIRALITLGELNKSQLKDLNASLPIRARLLQVLADETISVERRAKAEKLLNDEFRNTLNIPALDKVVQTSKIPPAPTTLDATRWLTLLGRVTIKPDADASRNELKELYKELIMGRGATSRSLADIVGRQAFGTNEIEDAFMVWVDQAAMAADEVDAIFAELPSRIGDTFSDTMAALFDGDPSTQAGDVFLGAIGNIMQEMGAALTRYGVIMIGLQSALFNPFTSGPAAVAAGMALSALGSALGGTATGKRSGLGSQSRPTSPQQSIELQRVITDPAAPYRSRFGRQAPSAGEAPVFVFPLMNPNDAASQRIISQARVGGKRRGLP